MAGTNAAAAAAEIDAYRFTVDAIVCVERAFEDLAGARLRQGPRMRTAGGAVVTPDMILEVGEGRGGAGYRAVGEIKSSFPQYRSAIDQMVRQVRHYDGELVGWGDEAASGGRDRRDDHDVVIVARSKHAPDFATGIPAALGEKGIEIKSSLSVISMEHEDGSDGVDRFFLKRLSGTISHSKADDALGRGWSINAGDLMDKIASTKFYDSRPPMPYIMSVLWSQAFSGMVHAKKLKILRMKAEVLIDVEVGRAHRLVSRLAPSSNPGCVKRAWVKDAMEGLVAIGLAERTGRDKYRVRYSMVEPRPAEWFARMTATGADHADGPG